MNDRIRMSEALISLSLAASLVLTLYLAGGYNYLLFHSLAELFSVIIACGIFMMSWNSRQIIDNT